MTSSSHLERRMVGLALAVLLAALALATVGAFLAEAREGMDQPAPPALVSPEPQDNPPDLASPKTLARDDDHVIVKGSQMPAFDGVAFHDLFVYAYDGAWKQIPWQFDEVAGGQITGTVNSTLNAQDELVFMASDTGAQAPAGSWIANADSRRYSRYQITVTDPINPTKKGWVYVYRSATATETVTTDYVSYNAATWVFTAQKYILGIIPYRMSANRLEMNGSGVDVLDRTKIRAFFPQFPLLVNEDELELAETPTTRDGRVRAYATLTDGAGNEITLIGYRSTYTFDFDLNFEPTGYIVGSLRLSADMSAAASGSKYYDANTPAGVTVDGLTDTVPSSPATDWWQISGVTGTAVQIADASLVGGTRTNYYKDNKTPDSGDTGDKVSYADCGAYIDHPNARIRFGLFYYILPANQPNVGATYWNRAMHPLTATATAQPYGNWRVFLPVVMSR
jgi:hypothetical protein